MTFLRLCCVVVVLAACGGEHGPPQAGDAGRDATASDAADPRDAALDGDLLDVGPGDANPADAGPPPDPLAEARDEARASLRSAIAARDAIAMDMRLDTIHLANDLVLARLDAIIGEKGLVASPGIIGEKGSMMALVALPRAAATTIVIVRGLATALAEIDAIAAAWAASSDAMLLALRDALVALRSDLVTLRTLLVARFREIVATVAVPDELVRPDYSITRRLMLMPDELTFHAIVEGRDTMSPTMTLRWSCAVMSSLAIRVLDDEDGSLLLALDEQSADDMALIPLGTPDVARAVQIRITETMPTTFDEPCDVILFGERHLRGPEFEIFPGEQAELSANAAEYARHLSAIGGTLAMVRSEGGAGDRALLPIVEAYLRERDGVSSPWRGAPATMAPDDVDVLGLELRVVSALHATLVASPLLTMSPRFMAILPRIDALATLDDRALVLLAEGDASTG